MNRCCRVESFKPPETRAGASLDIRLGRELRYERVVPIEHFEGIAWVVLRGWEAIGKHNSEAPELTNPRPVSGLRRAANVVRLSVGGVIAGP